MTAADILKECGFSSAEEVAVLDGKFPGRNGLSETGNIGTGNNSTLATFIKLASHVWRLMSRGCISARDVRRETRC